MASQRLLELIDTAKKLIEQNGDDYKVADAMMQYGRYAIQTEEEIELGLECLKTAKQMIERLIPKLTQGGNIWQLSEYCRENKVQYDIMNTYWDILKEESFWNFESFMFYMERKRPFAKQFYLPRMNTLHIVAKDLEDLENRKIKFYGLSMPSRVGKALDYDTPILTNNGWKCHGDLTIRDKVIGLDGEFKQILAIHNPCDMEYKVTFADGEKIICHGNHEWVVYDRHFQKNMTYETKFLKDNLFEKDGRCRFYIPQKEVVQGSHKSVWVDPYTLGVWLGDGRNQNPDICGDESDYPIVQSIIDAGYELSWQTTHKTTGVKYYGIKGLREQLQKYDMCHSRRRCIKHIPSDYLIADEEQRLELLAGLLDTDGYLAKKEHRYQFTTADMFLKEDFISLVNTFGWRTSVTEKEASESSSGIVGRKTYWVISFNPDRFIPCRLERKQLYEYSKQRKISIESIEKIPGNSAKGNCITVEGGIYLAGRTLKPTHNSTICIFFLAWVMMKRPNSHNAMGGHSGILAKGFFKELLNLINTDEYTFKDLYDYWHPGDTCLRDKSADEFTITLGNPDRFATFTARGSDATWTGAVDISKDGYLYIDDLVRDREHSLSPTRMENTFQEYLNKMVDRKNDGARELMVGTLWNVLDPLERMRNLYEGNPEYRFRKIPALNQDDESNFNYAVNGFSSAYYQEMRERLDNAEWMAKYQQSPYVREGILMDKQELRYFNGILPEGDSRVVSVCDVALGGGDSLSMPIGREYPNGDVYIFDWVFNPGTKEVTLPIVSGKIIANEITETRFEANQGGDLYCAWVDEILRKEKYKCSCTSKRAPNSMEKMSKIMAYADDVKRRFVFLSDRKPSQEELDQDAENGVMRYTRSKDYQKAMEEMTSFVTIGKNVHDDAIDSIIQLDMFVDGVGVRRQSRILSGVL